MSNLFALPEGNVQISFSGGRTSAFMLHQILEANGDLPDRCQVMFANTGREMPQTIDFVHEISQQWGVKIVWLEYDRVDNKATYKLTDYENHSMFGEPFELLIKRKKYLPNSVMRFCTTELKILTMKRYLTNALKWKKWTAAVGIRADESHRAKTDSKDRWSYWYPLLNNKTTKSDIQNFWQCQPFNLDLPMINGTTPFGNCDMCFLKSEKILANIAKQMPSKADWWIRMEHETNGTFRKGRDLEQFVDFVDRQADWVFDDESFFCQADGGECTDV